jgi:hypothetical protein
MRHFWYRCKRIFDIKNHYRPIKWFIQRGKRGWSNSDVWNLHYYLAEIIPEMLRRLQKNHCGYPGHGEANTPEKWEAILGQMIAGFEAAQRLSDSTSNENSKMVSVPCKDHPGFSEIEFTNPWTDEQVTHFKELDKQDTRTFKVGMKLFTKWFFALWD